MEWKSLRAGITAFIISIIYPPSPCSLFSSLSCKQTNSAFLFPSLHNHLVEHLNAEIVLQTISDVNMALDWIRSTFLYIRALKNPTHYGQSLEHTQIRIGVQLVCLCCRLKQPVPRLQFQVSPST